MVSEVKASPTEENADSDKNSSVEAAKAIIDLCKDIRDSGYELKGHWIVLSVVRSSNFVEWLAYQSVVQTFCFQSHVDHGSRRGSSTEVTSN